MVSMSVLRLVVWQPMQNDDYLLGGEYTWVEESISQDSGTSSSVCHVSVFLLLSRVSALDLSHPPLLAVGSCLLPVGSVAMVIPSGADGQA